METAFQGTSVQEEVAMVQDDSRRFISHADSVAPASVFSPWNRSEAAELITEFRPYLAGKPVWHRRGEGLLSAKAVRNSLLLVVEGIISVSSLDPYGREVLLNLGLPGDLIDTSLLPLWTASAWGFLQLRAFTDCSVGVLAMHNVRQSRGAHLQVDVLLWRTLYVLLNRIAMHAVYSGVYRPADRLIRYLTVISDVLDMNDSLTAPRALPLNDEQLAALSGVSVRHTRRIKLELYRKGVIQILNGRVCLQPAANSSATIRF